MEEESMRSYMGDFVKPVLKIWVTKYTTFADLKESTLLHHQGKQTSLCWWWSGIVSRINSIFSEYTPDHFGAVHLAKLGPSTLGWSAKIKNVFLIRRKSLNGLTYERDWSLNL